MAFGKCALAFGLMAICGAVQPALAKITQYECRFPQEIPRGGGWIPTMLILTEDDVKGEIIVFDPLNREQIRQIVQLLMNDISVRMDELGFTSELTVEAADYIAEVGYDANYGARPLRRLLQRRVENELSKRLLKGDVKTGDHIVVGFDPNGEGENKLTFTVIEQAPIPVELPLTQQS